jgi:cbb3-type cytochrome c oxidase subunit III
VVAVATGCGTGGLPPEGDSTAGQQLFVNNCGSCHTLADAGTSGVVGPNLDDAFGPGRRQGFKESTIRSIVFDQIKYPAPAEASPKVPPMPPNLVKGDDAVAVASYVASVAGLPPRQGGGGRIAATSGKEIFAQAGCGSCHTLRDAGSTGTVGPNLDEAQPSVSLAIDRVTNGRGPMPSFRGKLDEKQIQAVAEYVSKSAGSG